MLVVGGSGRLGTLLRRAWALAGQGGLLWQHRGGGDGPCFDALTDPAAYIDAAHGADAILNLAGGVGGGSASLAEHRDLALAALEAGRAAGVARVFLASSASVYGRARVPARETDPVAPVSDYGRAKAVMEEAALAWAAANPGGPAATCLRIGNVAGADQLLGTAPGTEPQPLDLFADGTGPARSYVGPLALADIFSGLFAAQRAGRALPDVLNIALDGAVRMDALLDADGRKWVARAAPDGLLREVRLDVTRLGAILGPLARAEAAAIVADLRSVSGVGA
ncbi:NAD-dependent epimerase/dehydratase family protein [Defluviimonas sp. SAOS-178_SWC]|uniref:NAD-dependent epimerase/dehydratase family protein n=1 Tax=Defluviimonas sp. SAOS-178_SWC TaxID=3121287 RepID=UPI003221A2AC